MDVRHELRELTRIKNSNCQCKTIMHFYIMAIVARTNHLFKFRIRGNSSYISSAIRVIRATRGFYFV